MIATVETITPDIATEYLKFNQNNRSLNKSRVEYYARLMKEGKWKLNGEGIQFLQGGALGNGQHRLSAIILANTPVQMLVVRGADNDSFVTYDQGKNRNAADIFNINGVSDYATVSSIVNRYALLSLTNTSSFLTNNLRHGGRSISGASKGKKLSNEELYEIYELNPSTFQIICKEARNAYRRLKLLSASDMGGTMAYLVLDKNHDIEFVLGFFSILCDMNNQSNVTINTLREKLYKDNLGIKKMTSMYKSQILIKAWNAYATGRELKTLSWNEEKEGKLQFI